MATNKRKDSAALFELIDKSTLKVPKQGGSLKIPSWWSSKTNPPSLSQPHAGTRAGARTAAEPVAFQKPAPSAVPPAGPTPAAPCVPAPAGAQPRLFEPPPADVSGTASPSIRPPVPPSGPRFAMVTAASKTDDVTAPVDAASPEPVADASPVAADESGSATAVMETPENGVADIAPDADPDAMAPESPESYAGLGTGRRIFAPQTMSQTDGIHRDWVSLQKSRLARTPMWAMVAGGAAVVIFLSLVVYMIMPHRPAATTEIPATSSPGSAGTKLIGPSVTPSLLPPQPHPTPSPLLVNDHHSVQNTPIPDNTPGHVYEQGSVPRSADLYYIKIATTSTESIARRNADFLAKHGVDVSIETQMSRSKRLLYILISVQGFPTIGDAHDVRKKIVDIGHLPPYFSSGHPAWDDAPVLKWSSLTRR